MAVFTIELGHTIISGLAGCGKTVLLKELLLRKKDENINFIIFDCHGEMKEITKHLKGKNLYLEENEPVCFDEGFYLNNLEFKTEYFLSYLQLNFKRRFTRDELHYLSAVLNHVFYNNNEKFTLEDLINEIRRRGKIGANLILREYLFQDRKMLTFPFFKNNERFMNLNFSNNHEFFHYSIPYFLTNLLNKIKNEDKEYCIVLEEFDIFNHPFIFSLIEDIVVKKKYKNVKLILLQQSLRFKEEQILTLQSFQTLFLMRQSHFSFEKIQKAFQFTYEEMQALFSFTVGETFKINGNEKELINIVRSFDH